jgi:hypothetical protein
LTNEKNDKDQMMVLVDMEGVMLLGQRKSPASTTREKVHGDERFATFLKRFPSSEHAQC